MKTGFRTYIDQQRMDEKHMTSAIAIAEDGKVVGNLPVGAVLVTPRFNLSECNTVFTEGDVLNHAEINVLKKARDLGCRKLNNAVLYSTLEPSIMSAMVALEHGVREIVFGAYDEKDGFVSSKKLNLDTIPLVYRGGVLAKECRDLLPTRMLEHTRETNEESV